MPTSVLQYVIILSETAAYDCLRPLEPCPTQLTKDEWISVLKLSTIWLMDNVGVFREIQWPGELNESQDSSRRHSQAFWT